jgi:hypothetical protein
MRHISVRRAGFESQIYDHTPHVLMSTELSSVHVSILTGGGTHRSRCCAEAGSAARIWILAKSSPELRLSRYLTFFFIYSPRPATLAHSSQACSSIWQFPCIPVSLCDTSWPSFYGSWHVCMYPPCPDPSQAKASSPSDLVL